MVDQLFELANWLLAILMWLLIGRIVLDSITRGRSTLISRLFHLLTDPVLRLSTPLFPRLSRLGQAILWVFVLLSLRMTLFVLATTF